MAQTLLIANTRSRSGNSWSLCEEVLRDRSDIVVCAIHEHDIDELVSEAVESGSTTIIAAGGDGTVSTVAHAILTLDAPLKLGILPTGTFNHFAKDLNIPIDFKEALRVIDEGHSRLVDIGKVNDRHFINNSSIGLYPFLVRQREVLQRSGLSKWFALVRVVIEQPLHRFSTSVRLGAGGAVKQTTNIFIGNNTYVMDGLSTGSRAALDEGKLFIALLRSASLSTLLRIAVKAFAGRAIADRELDVIGLTECVVDSNRKRVPVAYDGEVTTMVPPLRYSIMPKALKVIVPTS